MFSMEAFGHNNFIGVDCISLCPFIPIYGKSIVFRNRCTFSVIKLFGFPFWLSCKIKMADDLDLA